MHRKTFLVGFLVLFSLFVSAERLLVYGQATGSIYGTVTDETRAVLPDVTVTITHQETGLTRRLTTNDAGNYEAPLLPVGSYTVEAKRQGFARFVRSGIKLSVNENLRIDIVLKVGALTEEVVVKGTEAQVELRQSTLGEVVEERRIVELPLNGRNFIQLGTLQAGVMPPPPNIDLSQVGINRAPGGVQVNFVVHGLRQESNAYLLDGSINNDPLSGQAVLVPNPDLLAEFKILTTSYSAEFGRRAGSVVNVVTKSGTNEIHGSVYEFFRNDVFDARNFFVRNVPELRQNQYGFTLGGPIIKDRTFVFGGFEGFRKRQGIPRTVPVPSLLERAGDFSRSPRQPLDPATRQPFAGGIIPADRIDPVARNILNANLWPLPNAGPNLWAGAPVAKDDREQFMARIDHTWWGGKNQLTGRYLFDDSRSEFPFSPASFGAFPITAPGFPSRDELRAQNLLLMDTHTLSSELLNQFRFTYLRLGVATLITAQPIDPRSLGFTFPSNADLSKLGLQMISAAGVATIGKLGPTLRANNEFSVEDTVAYIAGSHTFKFGFEVRRSQINFERFTVENGGLIHNGTFTGIPFADFLLGRPFINFLSGGDRSRHFRRTLVNFFWEDTYKLNSRLTLTYGFRYDPVPFFHDIRGRLSAIIPGRKSEVSPILPTGILRPGDPGVPKGIAKTDKNNVAPRFGFAWDPFGKGKMSIRGAYGIFYDESVPNFASIAGINPPDVTPLSILVPPPPGLANPVRNVPDPLNTFTPFPLVIHLASDFKTPYVQQWSLSLQRELPLDLIVEAAYVGNKGTKLVGVADLNLPALTPDASPANTQARRPLRELGSLPRYQSMINSHYHALEFTVKRTMARSLTFVGAYTLSKAIDNMSSPDPSAWRIPGQQLAQNERDLRQERSLSAFDIRNRFSLSFVWELPFMRDATNLAGQVIGGWSVNGIVTLQSGRPFTVFDGVDRSLDGRAGDRPNLVGDPNLPSSERKPERWFNTAAFVPVTRGFGSAGRNIVFADGMINVDLSLIKNIRLGEARNIEFRAEFFNVFNHPNFGIPDANVTSATFGRVLDTSTPERVIQFGLKLRF
jgi:hypothetical protein